MNRVVSHFSCGAASAVATKLALAEYGHERVVIANAFLVEEHADNRRFLADCERWFEHPITVLRDEKYGASTHEVWRRKRYIKGPHGAPCSLALKRQTLLAFSVDSDEWVIGFTSEEAGRVGELLDVYPGRKFHFPLIEKNLSKKDCLALVDRAGIELPYMYRIGFSNANCVGCPKGGQNYWQKIRKYFPNEFVQIAKIQADIGPGANFIRFRSGPRKNERFPLTELPAGDGNMANEPSFSCSFFCEQAELDIDSVENRIEGQMDVDDNAGAMKSSSAKILGYWRRSCISMRRWRGFWNDPPHNQTMVR